MQRADVRICAFDIETTKLPLQFPNAQFDQVGHGGLFMSQWCNAVCTKSKHLDKAACCRPCCMHASVFVSVSLARDQTIRPASVASLRLGCWAQ